MVLIASAERNISVGDYLYLAICLDELFDMIRYFPLLLIVYVLLLTASCSKKEPVSPRKSIERVLIAPEMVIQKKGVAFDVAVRYYKDYKDQDKVSVSINGQMGTLQSEESAVLDGTTMVFRFPPIVQSGDYAMKVTIDNGQKVVEQQQLTRFVDDYTLATVWNNLQKDYLSLIRFRMDKNEDGSIHFNNFIYGEPYTSFGLYLLTAKRFIPNAPKRFIEGLSGNYILKFNNGSLEEIKVAHADRYLEQDYSPASTYAEINTIEGIIFVSEGYINNDKVRTYRSKEFRLDVHENPREVFTVVTKVQK